MTLDPFMEDVNAGVVPQRALSLIQPWAWAVVHGPKNIENMVWYTEIRGPFWIAASAQVTRRYYENAAEWLSNACGVEVPPMDQLVLGAIIGSATITDCILPGGFTSDVPGARSAARERIAKICGRARREHLLNGARWGQAFGLVKHPLAPARFHFEDQYGYVLKDRTPTKKAVPCKGHQRWWTVNQTLLEQLRSAA
jgi:hypothetical protein